MAGTAADRFEAIFVRKLSHALSEADIGTVRRFASAACSLDGTLLCSNELAATHRKGDEPSSAQPALHGVSDEEVIILMAPAARAGIARLNCMPSAERFHSCRLIGELLAAVGHVEAEGHVFVAATPNERVLAPAHELQPTEVARLRARGRARLQAAQLGTVEHAAGALW